MADPDDRTFRRRMKERRDVKNAQRRGVCAYDEGACACTGTQCPRREARIRATLENWPDVKVRAREDMQRRMGWIPGLEDL